LQPWVEDVTEQLAFGQLVCRSPNPSIRRVALIVIDNAVEVALKTFVEFERGFDHFGLKKAKWETDYKPSLKKVLDLVIDKTKVPADKRLILGYHETRNQLYHDPKLLAIEASDLAKYLKEAKNLTNTLYSLGWDEARWSEAVTELSTEVFPRAEPARLVTAMRKDDGVLKITGLVGTGDTDSVAIAIQALLSDSGRVPTFKELRATLQASGKAPSNLSDCIGRLRSRGILARDRLALTATGQKRYSSYF
jgi:hypothetical protein